MQTRAEAIDAIRELPAQLRELVAGLSAEQLTTAYNAPEWTIAQNVHHLADSHMMCYRRFKLILTTENLPFINYEQDLFAEMPDARQADVEISLRFLEGMHGRWAIMMDHLSEKEWTKAQLRNGQPVSLERMAQLYAQHGRDHLDQIQAVIDAMP